MAKKNKIENPFSSDELTEDRNFTIDMNNFDLDK